jgi:EAL domain
VRAAEALGAIFFYLPIIIAAVRFGSRAAGITALWSGLLAGPLLPADVSTAAPQPAAGWLTRLGSFIAVGLFVAWSTSQTRPNLLTTGRDAQIVREIRHALEAGHFHVFHQPQVDLATGQLVGIEALVRWKHPSDGIGPPTEFVPAAERTGLIKQLDTAVMRQAPTARRLGPPRVPRPRHGGERLSGSRRP